MLTQSEAFCVFLHNEGVSPYKSYTFSKQIVFSRIARIPYKMTPQTRQRISYKMNGPNPAKISNYISRLLYDSDFMPKSSILLLLQYVKVQAGSLQNCLRTGPRGPLN